MEVSEFRKNPFTILLIAANLVMFVIVEMTAGNTDYTYHMLEMGASYAPLVLEGEYYRLVTCMFLHFGMQHLVNNMLMLFCAGGSLERAVGSVRFGVIYFGAGILASVISVFADVTRAEAPVSAGASGAIFGVIGALLYVVILHKGRLETLTLRGMVLMIGLSLYYGFSVQGVDNAAHVGGFICGFLLAVPVCLGRKEKRVQN